MTAPAPARDIRRQRRADPGDERGLVSLWAFLFTLILFGFVGLAIDLWHVWEVKRDLAGMADSAAIAGAGQVNEVAFRNNNTVILEPTSATAAANNSLDAQTDLPALTSRVVFYSWVNDSMNVRVETEVDLTLLRLFVPNNSMTVRAEAEASPYWSRPTDP